jgi:hypothetical protein
MAYNFKSIADVEVVAEPTKSANVLIEEDGIIKKAPKAAIGGGEWDAIFEVIEDCSGYFESVDIVLGDYQTLKNKIDNGDFPNVLIKYAYSSNEYGLIKANHMVLMFYDESTMGIRFNFLCCGNIRHFWLFENGRTTNI